MTIIAITFLPPVSDYVRCKDMYTTSILMALDWDGYGLLGLDAIDPGQPPRCHIPVMKYPSDRMPRIAAHIIAAQIGIDNQSFLGDQDFAEPMFFIYNGKLNPISQTNRDAVCPRGKYNGLPGPVDRNPSGTGRGEMWSCDEYPFASTVSWRGPASVAAVTAWEQNRQGGFVNDFYMHNLQVYPYTMNRYPGQGATFACVVV